MEKKRRKSPIAIQQWVDSLPETGQSEKPTAESKLSAAVPSTFAKCAVPTASNENLVAARGILSRDASFQSDDASSHCSSVESVLEFRRPDPEAVLIGLGFGPAEDDYETARIPKRFLQPSKLHGVDVQKFLQQQRESKEAAHNYLYPYMQSTLNIGRDFKNNIPLRKDSTTGFDQSS